MTQLEQPALGEPTETDRKSLSEDVVALLDATYTQSILEAIRAEPKCARALAADCGASRPTVYRRLNSLQDAGLVESSMEYDADGHHRTLFEASFAEISIEVNGEDIAVTLVGDEPDSTARRVLGTVSGD